MHALSLVGVTTGTEICTYGELPINILDEWIEVSPNEIHLSPIDDVYLLSRRKVEGHTLTWIGLYRYASEIGGNRVGGYCGAGIWLLDTTAPGASIVQLLPQIVNQIRNLAIREDRFFRKLEEIKNELKIPDAEADRVGFGMQSLVSGGGIGTRNLRSAFLDLSNADDTADLGMALDWIQIGADFASYNRIFLSTSSKVASSARSKELLDILSPIQILRNATEQSGQLQNNFSQTDYKLEVISRQYDELLTSNNVLVSEHRKLQKNQETTSYQLNCCRNDLEYNKTLVNSLSEQNSSLKNEAAKRSRNADQYSSQYNYKSDVDRLESENINLRDRIRSLERQLNNDTFRQDKHEENMELPKRPWWDCDIFNSDLIVVIVIACFLLVIMLVGFSLIGSERSRSMF